MQFLDRAPGGDANTLRVIPDGVFLALDNKPRAVGAVALLQECGVIRLVLHKVGTDDLLAVPVIEAHAQGFIYNLLRKLQLREKGLLRFFQLRRDITAIQERHLRIVVRKDLRLYHGGVILPVKDAAGQFCYKSP